MNSILVYFILAVATVLGAFGGFFFKKCTESGDLKKTIFSPWLYIGGSLYLASAVFNIIVLKHLPYSVVLPLTSLTYIWSLGISYLFLNEKITKMKIGGIVFILFGAILLGI